MRSGLIYGVLLTFAPLVLVQAARETIQEAGQLRSATTIHARELLQYRAYGVGTLMSKYPQDFEPPELRGLPIGLQVRSTSHNAIVYPGSDGDLLLLVMPISKVSHTSLCPSHPITNSNTWAHPIKPSFMSQIFRNALPPNVPNMTMTVSDLCGFGTGNLAAGRMRIALFGSLEPITDDEESAKCKKAYLESHGDARGWAGERGPHSSFWGRLRVEKVYAFDGFGDVAYIGWVPLEMYREATSKMRSEKEVKKDWPVPRQPDDSGVVSPSWLFAETSLWMSDAPSVAEGEGEYVRDGRDEVEMASSEVGEEGKARFRIQL
ncbi:BQ2448_3483 [Microbotryum intermedium]|uniref:BQ2448_3483 protein n=1 Tax=Microbotryum intermedium TaxID=269621 RepID=A0A238FF33_9BASI|nr:BQ2448_3483 [Microbotryum intermedium]